MVWEFGTRADEATVEGGLAEGAANGSDVENGSRGGHGRMSATP